MAGLLGGDPTQSALDSAGASSIVQGKLEEVDDSSANWYFPREEVERNSPSLAHGIDTKRETYLRKSYCTFLQDLGMRLKVPQVTIATAITFCHRFYLRQSHALNDRFMVGTVCMFLAGKVEETPRTLKDVIIVSYGIRYRKDPAAANRIKQKKLYEQQKELILDGERLVLSTLGFDLNVYHPYRPLVAAIKKFKVSQNALAQVAWNFVNDGLRTSLCLQFRPHHIAAGAIFLAAKFLKVGLTSDGEKPWWQEFDVNPRQLEEVSNQMLELYEQNKIVPSNPDEVHNGRTAPDQNHAAPAANGHFNGKADMEFRDGIVGSSNEPRNRQYPEASDKRRAHDGDEFKDVDSGSEAAEKNDKTQDKRKPKWTKSEEGELPSRFEETLPTRTRHEAVEREATGYRHHTEHHNSNHHYYQSQRSDADRDRSRTHSKDREWQDREPKKSRHK